MMAKVFGLSSQKDGVDLTGDPEMVGPVGEWGARDGADWKPTFGRLSRRCRRYPSGDERGPRDTSAWESEVGAGLEIEVWEPAI